MATNESTLGANSGAKNQPLTPTARVAATPIRCVEGACLNQTPATGEIPHRVLQYIAGSDTCGTFTPVDGGPTLIVVGERASADHLHRLAAEHRLEPESLQLFAWKH